MIIFWKRKEIFKFEDTRTKWKKYGQTLSTVWTLKKPQKQWRHNKKKQCKNKHFVRQLQHNNGVYLKASESSIYAKPLVQLQLGVQTTTDTDQNKTSNATAKNGKSIIPACRLFIPNHHNGSLIQVYSHKKLGTLDNASKNKLLKPHNNSHTNPTFDNSTTTKDISKPLNPYIVRIPKLQCIPKT